MNLNEEVQNYRPSDATRLMDTLIKLLDESNDKDKILKEVKEILSKYPDDVNTTIQMDDENLDALKMAIYAQNVPIVKLLLNARATVEDYHLDLAKDNKDIYNLLMNSQEGGRRRNRTQRRRKHKKQSRRHHKK